VAIQPPLYKQGKGDSLLITAKSFIWWEVANIGVRVTRYYHKEAIYLQRQTGYYHKEAIYLQRQTDSPATQSTL